MIDAVQAQASKLSRFAVAPYLVRRFSFRLGGIGKNKYWWHAEPLFRVWRRNRLYEWADDKRLQELLLREGYSFDRKWLYKKVQQSQLLRFATCSWACFMRPSPVYVGRAAESFCALNNNRDYTTILSDEGREKLIKNEIAELLSQTNTTELVKICTGLNNGVKCAYIAGKHIESDATMGCAKYQAWLSFDNGEKWLLQIPRTGNSDVPSELVEYLIAIMQALPGRPFHAHKVSPSQKAKVLEQVAEIMLEIHEHPVRSAGSPVVDKGQIQISTLAKDRFVGLSTSGPCTTPVEYILAITGQYLDLIADGQLHHKHPLEAFLFYHYLHHNGAAIVTADMQGSFFLKHVDDKGNHLLVDEEFNVVGIVSWQFARTVPASEAFGPSYLTADLASMYSCNGSVTNDDRLLANALRERGAFDLASYAEGKDIMRRLHHGLGRGSATGEVRCLLKGMVEAVSGEQIDDIDLWMESQRESCRHDSRRRAIHGLCVEQLESRVALGNLGDLRAYD
ncbi:hypothetical protein AFGD_001065 [Aspergillus flavus]|nr:hypothetical protein AFGD_001065 [Aspergillus flavus]